MEQFLQMSGAMAFPPAGATELAEFERSSGLSLPDELRELYSTCNGLEIEYLGLRFLPLHEVMEYAHFFQNALGLFPLTDENDSDPYAVCCRGPLQGWVVHVRHDGDSSLDFRNVGAFVKAIENLSPDDDYPKIRAELVERPRVRSEADVAVGLATLQMARKMEDDFAGWAIRFGLSLLTENELPEFVRIFDMNWMTRRTSLEELAKIPHPSAAKTIADYREEISEFSHTAARALKAASLDVSAVGANTITLQPGPVHLNMEAWYDRRGSDDFLKTIVEYARNAIAGKPRPSEGVK